MRRTRWDLAAAAAAASLLVLGAAGCGDPPGSGSDQAAELPEACGESSSLQIVAAGTPVTGFEASSSVAQRQDEQTWVVGVADYPLDAGDLGDIGSLPAAPADGTRVVLRLHSEDGAIASGDTFTAADLGLAVSVATGGVETPVTSLDAQAQVAYVDDTTICGNLSVGDPATATDPDVTTVGGSFAASV